MIGLIGCLIVTVIFGFLRFIVPVEGKINKKDVFKDLAHIWVGVLIGLAFVDERYGVLALAITVLEVLAFQVRRKP